MYYDEDYGMEDYGAEMMTHPGVISEGLPAGAGQP